MRIEQRLGAFVLLVKIPIYSYLQYKNLLLEKHYGKINSPIVNQY
jgi:hypothetical protein